MRLLSLLNSKFDYSWESREKWTKDPYLDFDNDEFQNRLTKIRNQMEEESFDFLIVHGSPNFMDGNLRYVSGFESSFGNSFVIIPKSGELSLISESMPYCEPLHGQLFQTFIRDVRFFPNENFSNNEICPLTEILIKLINESGSVSKIGIISRNFFPSKVYEDLKNRMPQLKFQYADKLLQKLRTTKSLKEIQMCKRSAEILDKAMDTAFEKIKPGSSELEIASNAVKSIIENEGYVWNTFPVTCVSGPYATFRDVYPTNRKLNDGDLINIGLSCNYRGYQARIHRTTSVGQSSDEQKDLIDTAINLQEAIIGTTQFGVKINDLIDIKRTLLSDGRYKEDSSPFLCSGIGLDLFDSPILIDGLVENHVELEEGMVLTIGPSISKKNVGTACFQDTVLIDEKFHQVLNKFRKRNW